MINFSIVERFIGSPWVYAKNDCWAVARKASKAIFNNDMPLVDLPQLSNLSENISIFEGEANSNKWDKIDSPESGCMPFFTQK